MNPNHISSLHYNSDILYHELLIHTTRLFRIDDHTKDEQPILVRLDRENLIELMKSRIDEIVQYQFDFYQPTDAVAKKALIRHLQYLDWYNTLYCTSVEETKLMPTYAKGYKFGKPYDHELAMWAIEKTYLEDHLHAIGGQFANLAFFDFRHRIGQKWDIVTADLIPDLLRLGRNNLLAKPLLTESTRQEVPVDRPFAVQHFDRILKRVRSVKESVVAAYYSSPTFSESEHFQETNTLARRKLMTQLNTLIDIPDLRRRSVESVSLMHSINEALDVFATLVTGTAHPDFNVSNLDTVFGADEIFAQVGLYIVLAELSGAPLIVKQPLGNAGVVKAAHAAIKALEEGDLFLSCVWIRVLSNLII